MPPKHEKKAQVDPVVVHSMKEEEEAALLGDVGILGLGVVFGRYESPTRKIMWALVLLLAMVFMVGQVVISVKHYFSEPINVKVIYTVNKSLPFPVVTVCNQNRWNMTALKKMQIVKAKQMGLTINDSHIYTKWLMADLIGIKGISTSGLWNHLGPRIDEMLVFCWFGQKAICKDIGSWKTVHTILGHCASYTLNKAFTKEAGAMNNLLLRLRDPLTEKFQNKTGFRILLHWSNESPVMRVGTHGSYAYTNSSRDIRIMIKFFHTISTKERPCNNQEGYSYQNCLLDCFTKAILKQSKCLLPFMEDVKAFLPCNTTESYRKAEASMYKIFNSRWWTRKDCLCLRSCVDLVLEHSKQVLHLETNVAELRIYYKDLSYQSFVDEWAYSPTSLLCDIGGTLGLMLGASLLSFLELGELFVKKYILQQY